MQIWIIFFATALAALLVCYPFGKHFTQSKEAHHLNGDSWFWMGAGVLLFVLFIVGVLVGAANH